MTPAAETRAAADRCLTIAVCAPQVPFVSGGAEEQVAALCRELRTRGHRAELVTLPYKWYPRSQLWRSIKMWELADLGESDGRRIDLVIATKFPSYFVHHGRRVLWLTHQYRQLYDLYGTPYSEIQSRPLARPLAPPPLRGPRYRRACPLCQAFHDLGQHPGTDAPVQWVRSRNSLSSPQAGRSSAMPGIRRFHPFRGPFEPDEENRRPASCFGADKDSGPRGDRRHRPRGGLGPSQTIDP